VCMTIRPLCSGIIRWIFLLSNIVIGSFKFARTFSMKLTTKVHIYILLFSFDYSQKFYGRLIENQLVFISKQLFISVN